ncbi:MAG: M3 family metallopeptidase [Gammaproteobacteria bacterium]|nr:M3 family metallopeptidase [Gammaproteobacteria bacterium]
MNNPLLQKSDLPVFSKIKSEHMLTAINTILDSNRSALADILLHQPDQPNWQSLMQPLDELDDCLERAWAPIRHLNSVMDNPETRIVYDECLSLITDYHTEMGQNYALYKLISKLKAAANTLQLDAAQRKLLDDVMLGFKQNGVTLPVKEKNRFKEIQQELSSLSSAFEKNLLDATLAWHYQTDSEGILRGLPESALRQAEQAAREADKEGWLLTLQAPSYIAGLTYAEDRSLRQKLYTAYNTRASDQGPHAGQWDNSDNIEKILSLRYEGARLLGYKNYAEQSLARKMADNPKQVLRFLHELAEKALPVARNELAELRDFAAEELQGDPLQPWDVSYYSEKLRQQRYALSQEELKPWFPAETVLQGLFKTVARLFGISIRQIKTEERWHPDVRLYLIVDGKGDERGRFYLDLYARSNKRGGAWMDECCGRFRRQEHLQIPVAFLTCNLTPPVGNTPALFTHDEVTTLFHEFGHGLHHMLTQVEYPGIAGIRGVEWDAVELPSQFMENWCWQSEALQMISGHYQTGEPLPVEMIEKLKAAKNFHAAIQLMRQTEFSLFDLRLHSEYNPRKGSRHQALLNEIRKEVSVLPPPDFVRFQHGFSHIFAGGYAAGYYSYKWAEVLSADAFSRFEEQGVFDSVSGHEFLSNILERGGSDKAINLFKKFRGREPTVDALLRHSGLAA